jgi:hypothetical protein
MKISWRNSLPLIAHGMSSIIEHFFFHKMPFTPLPLKPHVRPFVQPLPTNYEFHKVQNVRTTNLSLATPRLVASHSHNLEISSQLSRQFNNSGRYKRGGMVGPSAIYIPFFPTSALCYKIPKPPFSNPFSAMGSWSHHLRIHIP